MYNIILIFLQILRSNLLKGSRMSSITDLISLLPKLCCLDHMWNLFTKFVTGFFVKVLVTSKYWSSSLLTRMSNTGFPPPAPSLPQSLWREKWFLFDPKMSSHFKNIGFKNPNNDNKRKMPEITDISHKCLKMSMGLPMIKMMTLVTS